MKKWLFKLSLVAMTFCSYQFKPFKPVVALSLVVNDQGWDHFGRTEDYPYFIQMVASTTRTMWWLMRRIIRKGINWKTNPMVFTYPHAASEMGNTQRLMTLLVEMVVTVPLVNTDLTKPASL